MTFDSAVVVRAGAGYTGDMKGRWQEGMRELLVNPLAWASYVAWSAVWLTVTGAFGWSEPRWWVDALLLLFLFVWMGCLLDGLPGRWLRDALLIALTALTITALWLVPSGATPILLILLATQYANRFEGKPLIAAMVAINLAFIAIMTAVWGVSPRNAGFSLIGFIGFQMFAVLVMRYAIRSEEMAEALKSVNARLLATRSLLAETARDQERLRLSRELHDIAGHKLTALKLNLRGLERRMDPEVAGEIGKATELADELLQDLRSVVRHLRETEGIDLAESLREVARPLPRPRLELQLDGHVRIPRAEQAEALLRTVQEALTNAARHGPAETLHVRLARHDRQLVLTAEDDGRFHGPVHPGNGLTGMHERLAELDGTLDVSRSRLGGLKLTATLPLEANE